MNTSGDRLKALLVECNLTPSDFAAQRSVTPQHVNNWFKRGVPLARLDEIADLFCVTRQWLRSGECPKHPSPILRPCMPKPLPPPLQHGYDGQQVSIAVRGLQNGTLANQAQGQLPLPVQALECLGVPPAEAMCLQMPGANMAPLIPKDATLAIDCSLTQVIDGQIYALLHDGQLRIHSLTLGQNGTLCLHSHDRRNYAVERYTKAQRQAQNLKILGWVFWWSWFSRQRPG